MQAHNDDISQILILNKKSIANFEQQLFQSELEKYRPHQNRLVQASHKQAALMRELTVTFNSLLQDKRVRAEQSKYESIQRQRGSVVGKYKRAYQEFLDLFAGLQSAKNWYKEMKETVESLEKNVETFVNNRRSEGAQLLSQIESERAASKNSHAAMEQERIRVMMERISMDPPPNTTHAGKPPGPTRNAPAPLTFSPTGSMYPKYSGPSSPPPHQITSPQSYMAPGGFNNAPYNPSSHGRIPGPASPLPTQTSFNIGPRVPASPAPGQTTFNQHFSTYGNPAAMQQQPPGTPQQQNFMLHGGVPPPPPGPPPLGPQQTVHYNQDYYAHQAAAGGRPPSRQQGPHGGQPQDPWAGLSAWK